MTEKKVDAWMPLHIGKYLSATGHLSVAEHGMYLLLLMHTWNSGGVIPAADERIMNICRSTPKAWAKARATIMAFLTRQPDGTYRQKRLDVELTKAAEIKTGKSEGGRRGAEARWSKHGKANGNANGSDIGMPMGMPMTERCPIPVQRTTEPKPTPPSPPASRGGVDNPKSTPKADGGQWWRSDEGTIAKGRKLGISARTGETMREYAARLRMEIAERKRARTQDDQDHHA